MGDIREKMTDGEIENESARTLGTTSIQSPRVNSKALDPAVMSMFHSCSYLLMCIGDNTWM